MLLLCLAYPKDYILAKRLIYICYDLSSELRLHLGKDLRREKGRCISGKV